MYEFMDLTEVFNWFQSLWKCIPLPIMQMLGVLAMFSVFGSFRNHFSGGDSQ